MKILWYSKDRFLVWQSLESTLYNKIGISTEEIIHLALKFWKPSYNANAYKQYVYQELIYTKQCILFSIFFKLCSKIQTWINDEVGQAKETEDHTTNRAKVVFRAKDGTIQNSFESVCMTCFTWYHSPGIKVNQTKASEEIL